MRRILKSLFIPLSALLICIGSGFAAWHFNNIQLQHDNSIKGNGVISSLDIIDKIGEIQFNCSTFGIELDDIDKVNGNLTGSDGSSNNYRGVNFFAYDSDGSIIVDDGTTEICENDLIPTFVPNENFFNTEFKNKDYKIKFVLEPYTKDGQLFEGLLKFIKFGFGRDEITYIANSNEIIRTKEELLMPANLTLPIIRGSYINLEESTGIFKPKTLEEYLNYVKLLKQECDIQNGDDYDFILNFDLRITMYVLTTCSKGHIDQQYNTNCTECGERVGGDLDA